jgi:hypothetical protein
MRSKFPYKNATFLIIGLLAVLLLIALFLTNFGDARRDFLQTSVEVSALQCQNKCQSLLSTGFNFDSCADLMASPDAQYYINDCAEKYGDCIVTIKRGINCFIK